MAVAGTESRSGGSSVAHSVPGGSDTPSPSGSAYARPDIKTKPHGP